MTAQLSVTVHGRPAPQGSKTRMPNGAVVEASKYVKPWRQNVCAATESARQQQGWKPARADAISVWVLFTLARPANHYRSGRHRHELKPDAPQRPATMPDLDKLVRATLDGLADGGALVNDSRVTELWAAKAYPGGALDSLDGPGAVIVIRKAGES